MADNLRAFTTQEVLNKVYSDSSGNSIGINAATSKETLNAALDTTNSRLNVSLAGGTISGDVTIAGDLTVNGNGSGNYDEIINGTVDISIAGSLDNQEYTALRLKYDDSTGASDDSGVSLDWTWQDNATSETTIGKISTVRSNGDNHGAMNFYTANAGSVIKRMTIDDTGDVGIGDASPDYKLDVETTANSDVTVANFQSAIDANGEHSIIRVGHGSKAAHMGLLLNSADTAYFGIDDNPDDGNGIYVNESGQIGIGNKAPSNNLYIEADSGDEGITIHSAGDTGNAITIDANRSGADSGIGTMLGKWNGTTIGYMGFFSGADTTNKDDGILKFATTPSGGSVTERMRIDSTGEVYIGTSSQGVSINGNTSATGTITGINRALSAFKSLAYNGLDHTFKTSSTTRMVIDANSRISLSNNDSGTDNTIFGKNAGLAGLSGGTNNVLIGEDAGNDMTSADHNTAVGYQSMDLITTLADGNTAVGYQSLHGNITTQNIDNCVAIGKQTLNGALTSDADGTVAVGMKALYALTSGQKNVAIGYQAQLESTIGDSNIAIGYNAMFGGAGLQNDNNIAIGGENAAGSVLAAMGGQWASNRCEQNIAIGTGSLAGAMNDSHDNVAVGYKSLNAITTGDDNIGIGSESLMTATTEIGNTVMGYKAGKFIRNDTSDYNVFIGTESGVGGTATRNHNIAMGYRAMGSAGSQNNIGGNENIFIGSYSGNGTWEVAGCDGNTAIGYDSLSGALYGANLNTGVGKNVLKALTQGDYNVAIGADSMIATTTGSANTVVGYQALNGDTDGNGADNTALGHKALHDAISPSKNVAIGDSAMRIMNGSANGIADCVAIGANAFYGDTDTDTDTNGTIAIGKDALKILHNGQYNIAIGYHSMDEHESGRANTCLGWSTMAQSGGDPTAQDNTFIGASSGSGDWADVGVDQNTAVGYSTMAGAMNGANHNTALGAHALEVLVSGDSNVGVGALAGNAIQSGSNNVCIGRDADVSAENASNQIVIGQGVTGVLNNSVHLGNTSVNHLILPPASRITTYAGTSIADDAQIKVADSTAGAATVYVYDETSGAGGVFFCTYLDAAVKIAGSSTTAATDSDGNLCVYKSTSSHDIFVKNRLGATRSIAIIVVGAQVTV